MFRVQVCVGRELQHQPVEWTFVFAKLLGLKGLVEEAERVAT